MLGRSIHTAALACPGSTPLVRGTRSWGVGRARGRFIPETPSSLAHHVLSAGLCSKPPLAFPAGLPECERFKARRSR